MSEENKNQDTHGTKMTTKWVHKHRTVAKFFVKSLVVVGAALTYYLKNQEKKIEQEEKKEG
jgi:hypothetical protein